MVNEYLLRKDARLKQQIGSKLEHAVATGTPVRLRQVVLQSAEVRQHAQHCKQFDPAQLEIGMSSRFFEEQLFLQQMRQEMLPPLHESTFVSREQQGEREEVQHTQRHEQVQRMALERGKEYGVGAGFLPVTCNCGQTFDVRTSASMGQYGNFGEQKPSVQGSYLSSTQSSGDVRALYGHQTNESGRSYGVEDNKKVMSYPS